MPHLSPVPYPTLGRDTVLTQLNTLSPSSSSRAICQAGGGSTRARSAEGSTLWRTRDSLLPHRWAEGSRPNPGQGPRQKAYLVATTAAYR